MPADARFTIVVAPDSFGGALDSVGVAAAIATGWTSAAAGRGDPQDRWPTVARARWPPSPTRWVMPPSVARTTTTDALGRAIDADVAPARRRARRVRGDGRRLRPRAPGARRAHAGQRSRAPRRAAPATWFAPRSTPASSGSRSASADRPRPMAAAGCCARSACVSLTRRGRASRGRRLPGGPVADRCRRAGPSADAR